MDLSPLTSFFDNIKQKTTNPFLGTLITVWSISNWELLYSVFTFDAVTKQSEKLIFIKNYFASRNMLGNLFLCIGESVVILVVTYFLLNISRLIINFYENRLTPWIYLISKPKSIIELSKYDNLMNDRNSWVDRYEKERTERERIQSSYDSLAGNYAKKESELIVQTEIYKSENVEYKSKNKDLDSKVNELETSNMAWVNIKDDLEAKLKDLTSDISELYGKEFKSAFDKEEDIRVMPSVVRFLKKYYSKDLISAIKELEKGTILNEKSYVVKFLIQFKIIELIILPSGQELKTYLFTDGRGKLFKELYRASNDESINDEL